MVLKTSRYITKMNSKGQGVFIGFLVGIMIMILFVLALPLINDFITVTIDSETNPIVQLIIYFIPFLAFIMIIWWIIATMRSG